MRTICQVMRDPKPSAIARRGMASTLSASGNRVAPGYSTTRRSSRRSLMAIRIDGVIDGASVRLISMPRRFPFFRRNGSPGANAGSRCPEERFSAILPAASRGSHARAATAEP